MSFKDIFKKSFLEGYASAEITTFTIVAALGIACLLALYIFLQRYFVESIERTGIVG